MTKSWADFKKITFAVMISLSCFFAMIPVPKPVFASLRGLYVIADLKAPMAYNPIQIYDIQPAPNYLVYQTTLYALNHHPGSGAVDLTIDSDSQTLFITYESTNIIQIMNATTFADLGTTRAPEAKNLAGIVYDHDRRLIYTVDRMTSNLYVFEWNSSAHALTFESHVNLTHTSEAYGIALDEANDILYVADGGNPGEFDWYATDTWTHLGTKVTTHAVIGIAVDAENGFIYTSGWEFDYGLYKYDMTTDKETAVLNGTSGKYAQMVAVEVDSNSSLVYTTTYDGGSVGYTDVLVIFDSNLNELWRSGDIGNPTGIAISMKQAPYFASGSSTIVYLLAAIFSLTVILAGVLAALGIFYAFKRKKRGSNQTKNRRLAPCLSAHICHLYIRGVYRLWLDPSFHKRQPTSLQNPKT